MNPYILFIGTIFIIILSWFISVKHGRYHGIPRFFVFESILILVLLNADMWFVSPLSPLQIASWILLAVSGWAAVSGFLLLKRLGKPDENFENTSRLVKSGLYRYIRHPLYFSLFLLASGIILKDPAKLQLLLGIITTVCVYLTARMEEGEMLAKFGDEYREYMRESKMFIPFIL
ncbi:MAG: isoprenylcysteine carboxylmethyltransferase family protein [Bacteroidales bacterium]|jgi:protein-S-isoprenylcysteine O-methyltransferase Ste14|nr:isoprenylcysteine carboxylmethyltransferase family protein [Bacteroidales bacterium]MCU0407566.1 isoprenylcysteine carboxylmethyltransferase family protein [Bacteroidales bacterium]